MDHLITLGIGILIGVVVDWTFRPHNGDPIDIQLRMRLLAAFLLLALVGAVILIEVLGLGQADGQSITIGVITLLVGSALALLGIDIFQRFKSNGNGH